MKNFVLIFPLIFGFLMQNTVYAQNKTDGISPKPLTATISAKGTVLAPISVVSTRDLDFGNDILPGISRTIDKNSTSAGKFSIMGESGKEISIEVSLPPELISGEEHMIIAFTPTDGGYKLPGGSVVDFDPANPVNAVFGSDGTMDVLLGGTVQPTYSQPAGLYSGTVTVTFYYTGN
ncbi:MAG: DUF4402 domain-containing protein [Bacteroidetes bacterium]|nr:DUF4402 domain-containing protein [Bacteroidota bacterium]